MEFAALAPILLTLMFGTLEVGRYLLIVNSLRQITGEAARQALVSYNTYQSTGSAPYSAAAVTATAPFINNAQLTVTATACVSHAITVTATYPFVSVIPSFTSMNGALTTANFTTQIYC